MAFGAIMFRNELFKTGFVFGPNESVLSDVSIRYQDVESGRMHHLEGKFLRLNKNLESRGLILLLRFQVSSRLLSPVVGTILGPFLRQD